MEQKSRVARKKEKARQRILEAAEYLFFQKQGYDKSTIHDIAERADVSTGAVYTHFPSKQDIMAVLIDQLFSIYEKGVLKILKSSQTGIETIIEYIEYNFNLLKQPKFTAFIHYMGKLSPGEIEEPVFQSLKKKANLVNTYIEEMFRIGVKDGTIEEVGPLPLMAFTFSQIIHSFIRDITTDSLMKVFMNFPDSTESDILDQFKLMLITSLRSLNSRR